jgi:hypothetical protein
MELIIPVDSVKVFILLYNVIGIYEYAVDTLPQRLLLWTVFSKKKKKKKKKDRI